MEKNLTRKVTKGLFFQIFIHGVIQLRNLFGQQKAAPGLGLKKEFISFSCSFDQWQHWTQLTCWNFLVSVRCCCVANWNAREDNYKTNTKTGRTRTHTKPTNKNAKLHLWLSARVDVADGWSIGSDHRLFEIELVYVMNGLAHLDLTFEQQDVTVYLILGNGIKNTEHFGEEIGVRLRTDLPSRVCRTITKYSILAIM